MTLTSLRPLRAGVAILAMASLFFASGLGGSSLDAAPASPKIDYFNRIATYSVSGDVAEIVTATVDGMTLIYTDSGDEEIGFVDITNPAAPVQLAILPMPGEPTSVTVTPDGKWALVAVHGTPEVLVVIDLADRTIERQINIGGQPDSVAVSPDGRYAVVVIENERDEDVNDGLMPQLPSGFLQIVDLVGLPAAWTLRPVDLTGLADRFPTDAEAEFVDINQQNQAAVTLQENNHIVIVDLPSGAIVTDFSAGTTTHAADLVEDDEISFTDTLTNARREPDAIHWTPDGRLVTANEGDYTVDLDDGEFVGGRDFSIFSATGALLYEAGASLELEAVKHGFYPDDRSENKGIEPEGIEIAQYGNDTFLFVGAERGDFVAVYLLKNNKPKFVQLLPSGDAPEGLIAIPARGLFVSANEDGGTIAIFQGVKGGSPEFPMVVSNGVPWSALSGLVSDKGNTFWAVPDSFLPTSRIWRVQAGADDNSRPWEITQSIPLTLNGSAVSYDLEGIAMAPKDGGWWVVSEGAENYPDTDGDGVALTKNLLIRVNKDGSVAAQVELPQALNEQQRSNGYEGVTTNADGSQVYVAFQRPWGGDPSTQVKIGRYTPATGQWAFFRYPLDASPNGGTIGLSEIVALDDTTFAVIERDNKAGADARVKRIYEFSIAGLTPAAFGGAYPLVSKTLVRDLLITDGWTLEKIEGLAVRKDGDAVVVNDNDGFGYTRLQVIDGLFD